MKAFVIDDGTEEEVIDAIRTRKLSVQQLRYDLEQERKKLNRAAIIEALSNHLLLKKIENYKEAIQG